MGSALGVEGAASVTYESLFSIATRPHGDSGGLPLEVRLNSQEAPSYSQLQGSMNLVINS